MSGLSRPTRVAGVASALSRASALARELVFAAVFGASPAADAWLAASRVPNLFRDVLAEGALTAALVPALSRHRDAEGTIGAFGLLNALLGVLLGVLGVLTGAMILLSEPATLLVAAGFADTAGKLSLTATLVRWVAPGLAAASLSSSIGALLLVQGRFFIPAIPPLLVNLLVIGACVWGEGDDTTRVWRLAVASTVGSGLGVVMQLMAAWRSGFRFRPHLRGHPALRDLLLSLGPSMMTVGLMQLGGLVDTQLAASVGDGALAAVTYAFRLAQLPRSLAAAPIAVAGLAVISAALARRDTDSARQHTFDAVTTSLWVGLPAMAVLMVGNEAVVRLVYQRGAFSEADVQATAAIVAAYAPAALAFVLHGALIAVLAAWGDTRRPMWLALLAVVVKIPLAWWWVTQHGVVGIALAHSAVALAEAGVLLAIVCQTTGMRWPRPGRMILGIAALVAGWELGARVVSLGGGQTVWLDLSGLAVGALAYLVVSGVPGGLRRG